MLSIAEYIAHAEYEDLFLLVGGLSIHIDRDSPRLLQPAISAFAPTCTSKQHLLLELIDRNATVGCHRAAEGAHLLVICCTDSGARAGCLRQPGRQHPLPKAQQQSGNSQKQQQIAAVQQAAAEQGKTSTAVSCTSGALAAVPCSAAAGLACPALIQFYTCLR